MSAPPLFGIDAGTVVLSAVKCDVCDAVLFPPQHYGCESCGAAGERLTDVTVPATGRIHSFALVQLHAELPTPFQIAEVVTDAAPLVRARLDHPAPVIGAPVVGIVRDGVDGAQLVFVPEEVN